MFTTLIAYAVAGLVIFLVISFLLFPLALLSGVWAHYSAKEHAAKLAEIEALLAED